MKINYRLSNSILFDIIKTGPFTIKRQIKKLTYELDFPKNIKIHFFFSIIYLETTKDNFYNRFNPPPTFIIINKKQTHLIDRIFKKEKYRERNNSTRK
jgi:hypothetical protein